MTKEDIFKASMGVKRVLSQEMLFLKGTEKLPQLKTGVQKLLLILIINVMIWTGAKEQRKLYLF